MTAQAHDSPMATATVRRRTAYSHYSRAVRLAKIVLPAAAATLLILVLIWPSIEGQVEQAVIDVPDARPGMRSQVTNPRFSGLDNANRPFTVAGEVAYQTQEDTHTVIIEQPRAEMSMGQDGVSHARALNAQYHQDDQRVALDGDVVISRSDGYDFATEQLMIDLERDRAWTERAVSIHGPGVDLTASGIVVVNGGQTVHLWGPARLVMHAPGSAPGAGSEETR